MLNFLDKPWKSLALALLVIFMVGFIVGYLTMFWYSYSGNYNGIKGTDPWQALSPF